MQDDRSLYTHYFLFHLADALKIPYEPSTSLKLLLETVFQKVLKEIGCPSKYSKQALRTHFLRFFGISESSVELVQNRQITLSTARKKQSETLANNTPYVTIIEYPINHLLAEFFYPWIQPLSEEETSDEALANLLRLFNLPTHLNTTATITCYIEQQALKALHQVPLSTHEEMLRKNDIQNQARRRFETQLPAEVSLPPDFIPILNQSGAPSMLPHCWSMHWLTTFSLPVSDSGTPDQLLIRKDPYHQEIFSAWHILVRNQLNFHLNARVEGTAGDPTGHIVGSMTFNLVPITEAVPYPIQDCEQPTIEFFPTPADSGNYPWIEFQEAHAIQALISTLEQLELWTSPEHFWCTAEPTVLLAILYLHKKLNEKLALPQFLPWYQKHLYRDFPNTTEQTLCTILFFLKLYDEHIWFFTTDDVPIEISKILVSTSVPKTLNEAYAIFKKCVSPFLPIQDAHTIQAPRTTQAQHIRASTEQLAQSTPLWHWLYKSKTGRLLSSSFDLCSHFDESRDEIIREIPEYFLAQPEFYRELFKTSPLEVLTPEDQWNIQLFNPAPLLQLASHETFSAVQKYVYLVIHPHDRMWLTHPQLSALPSETRRILSLVRSCYEPPLHHPEAAFNIFLNTFCQQDPALFQLLHLPTEGEESFETSTQEPKDILPLTWQPAVSEWVLLTLLFLISKMELGEFKHHHHHHHYRIEILVQHPGFANYLANKLGEYSISDQLILLSTYSSSSVHYALITGLAPHAHLFNSQIKDFILARLKRYLENGCLHFQQLWYLVTQPGPQDDLVQEFNLFYPGTQCSLLNNNDPQKLIMPDQYHEALHRLLSADPEKTKRFFHFIFWKKNHGQSQSSSEASSPVAHQPESESPRGTPQESTDVLLESLPSLLVSLLVLDIPEIKSKNLSLLQSSLRHLFTTRKMTLYLFLQLLEHAKKPENSQLTTCLSEITSLSFQLQEVTHNRHIGIDVLTILVHDFKDTLLNTFLAQNHSLVVFCIGIMQPEQLILLAQRSDTLRAFLSYYQHSRTLGSRIRALNLPQTSLWHRFQMRVQALCSKQPLPAEERKFSSDDCEQLIATAAEADGAFIKFVLYIYHSSETKSAPFKIDLKTLLIALSTMLQELSIQILDRHYWPYWISREQLIEYLPLIVRYAPSNPTLLIKFLIVILDTARFLEIEQLGYIAALMIQIHEQCGFNTSATTILNAYWSIKPSTNSHKKITDDLDTEADTASSAEDEQEDMPSEPAVSSSTNVLHHPQSSVATHSSHSSISSITRQLEEPNSYTGKLLANPETRGRIEPVMQYLEKYATQLKTQRSSQQSPQPSSTQRRKQDTRPYRSPSTLASPLRNAAYNSASSSASRRNLTGILTVSAAPNAIFSGSVSARATLATLQPRQTPESEAAQPR